MKFEKIRSHLCKSDQIGVEKDRFFTTLQSSNKVGGVSIFLPQYLDNCLSVIYTKADQNEIPRFISIICKLQNSSTFLICGYYGSAQPNEKYDSLKRFLSHLEELNEKFSIENLIIGGDFNLNLDTISRSNCQESKIFNEILSLFCLIDSKTCGSLPNDKETRNMKYNGLNAILSQEACTYVPLIANQKSNRIDGIFSSSTLQMKCEHIGYCITLELPCCDHRGVFLSLTWQSIGVPCDTIKPDFFFRGHLLDNKQFIKSTDKKMKRFLKELYYKQQGFLRKDEIENCSFNELENLIFDAFKSNDCQDFSAIDLLYQLLQIIRDCQNKLISDRNSRENTSESRYISVINQLEKARNLIGTQKHQLRAACKGLADLKRLQVKRKAKDFFLNFEALNETGTKAFFRQKTARRQKSFIRLLKAKDGSYLTDSLAIENEFHNFYKDIFEGEDPFKPELFSEFISDCKIHLDKFQVRQGLT